MTRSLAAARLYVLNKWMLLWIPLIVLGSMVVLTIAIQAIVLAAGGSRDAVMFNGAFQAGLWCLLAVAVAASTQMFPFAFAMSLTRRDFVLGTLITAVCVGVGYGLVYGLIAWFETLTDGFWIGAHSFYLAGFVGSSPGTGFAFYGGLILFMFMMGFASSMLFKRFAWRGLVIAGIVAVILISALGAWAGMTNAWAAIGRWCAEQTAWTVGGYALAASVLLAGATFLMIRHAEP